RCRQCRNADNAAACQPGAGADASRRAAQHAVHRLWPGQRKWEWQRPGDDLPVPYPGQRRHCRHFRVGEPVMAFDPLAGQNNGVNTDGRGKPAAPVSPPPYSPFHILPKVGGPFWLLTFLDVISLLLAFFIMLFAMSNPRTAAWEDLSATLADRLAPNVE